MATPAKPLDVCVDTCVLVNFALVVRLDLFAHISDVVFHVPQEVLDEITIPEQRNQVEAVVGSGGLRMTKIEAVDELAAFADYLAQFGRGESACLAIATCRNWAIATDETKDRRLSREIGARGIQIINTLGIVLKSIHHGMLTVEAADGIKAELEKNRFRMSFDSFRGLVG